VKQIPTTGVSLETMLIAATFDPSCRPFFYRNIASSEIFAGVLNARPTRRIPQFAAVDREGGRHLAVFTDPSMVPSPFAPLGMKFADFVSISEMQKVSLNPGQAVTKDFSVQELSSILGGDLSFPTAFAKGAPSEFELVSVSQSKAHQPFIVSLLADHPGVTSTWMADAKSSSGSPEAVGTWVGVNTSTDEDWLEVARECTILLSTLDNPPPWFTIERITIPPRQASLLTPLRQP
jgi:hypothetical protein